MSGRVFILRGLPGHGKTTVANWLAPGDNYSADMYFESLAQQMSAGRSWKTFTYNDVFDPKLLPEAHAACYNAFHDACLNTSYACVAVHNTNSCLWEFQKYIDTAEAFGHEVRVIHVKCVSRVPKSVHNVPDETVQKMIDRWEAYPGELTISW